MHVNALLFLAVYHGKRSTIVGHGLLAERMSAAHPIQNILNIANAQIEPQLVAHSFQKLRHDSVYVSYFQRDSGPHMFVVPNEKFRPSPLQGLSSRITERKDQNPSIDAATATTPRTVRGSARQLCGKRTCEQMKVCSPEHVEPLLAEVYQERRNYAPHRWIPLEVLVFVLYSTSVCLLHSTDFSRRREGKPLRCMIATSVFDVCHQVDRDPLWAPS